jgi:hypothetical protein
LHGTLPDELKPRLQLVIETKLVGLLRRQNRLPPAKQYERNSTLDPRAWIYNSVNWGLVELTRKLSTEVFDKNLRWHVVKMDSIISLDWLGKVLDKFTEEAGLVAIPLLRVRERREEARLIWNAG